MGQPGPARGGARQSRRERRQLLPGPHPGRDRRAAGSAASGGDLIEISVTDQGIGISEKDRERIFERFYRVDPARSRATGGTGLGLSIVKHVAASHGGEVTVWSAEGQGSTFTLRLPEAGSARERAAIDKADRHSRNRLSGALKEPAAFDEEERPYVDQADEQLSAPEVLP